MFSLLILAPLFSVILLNIPLTGIRKKAAFWLALAMFVAQIIISIFPVFQFFASRIDIYGTFLKFNFFVDGLTLVLLFCIGLILLVTLLIGSSSINDENKRFNFINLLLIVSTGLNGVVMVTDIFSLYVFIEIATLASFILIAFQKEKDALEGAFKYIVLSAIASVLMLSAIALFVLLTGSTYFSVLSTALKTSHHDFLAIFAIAIFICGLFIKGGLMPFHGWLPDAYSSAPAPVSVLLAGAVTKTLGIYPLLRLYSMIFGFDIHVKNVLLAVGLISIVFGALAAIGQSDFKRMLAYSSISQVGYIVVGLGCGTYLGFIGAVFHLFNHAIFKSLLFVNSAAVESQTGTRDMNKMGGLAQRMPLTGATSVVALLSAAGIPPLSGFWSKLIIVVALWSAGYRAYSAIAIIAGVITLAYLLSMQRRVFFGKLGEGLLNIREAGPGLAFPSLILAGITIGVGIAFPFMLKTAFLPLYNLLGK